MRALILVAAVIALSGCWTTDSQRTEPQRIEQTTSQPSSPLRPTVAVKYKGDGGFDLAAQKADAYCKKRYGGSTARLLADDMKGHARFECAD